MILLDHLILRVRNQAESIRFYQQILAFKHEGRVDPFDILRVNEGFTLDLMEQVPEDQVHLAFCLERAAFDAIPNRDGRHNPRNRVRRLPSPAEYRSDPPVPADASKSLR